MGFSLGNFIKKYSSPLTNATTKVVKKHIIKPLDKIISDIGSGGKDAFVKGFGVEPVDKDPMGLGDDIKPLEMPGPDMAVVEEARRRALLARQRSSGRRSTILADTRY